MKLTKTEISKVTDQENVLAYVNIELDNFIRINGIVIRNGQYGPWLAMPSKKSKDGKYSDIVHAVSKEARKQLQEAVLAEFDSGKSTKSTKQTSDDDSDF